MRNVAPLLFLVACRIVNEAELPDPPSFRILVEPDTVVARINAQQRTQLDLLVRVLNDGPGPLFIPECGHELQRAEPNGSWTRVHAVTCPPRTRPPFAVDAGEGYGVAIRIVAPADSVPWRRGSITGRYRAVNYISTEYRPAGAWGRPIALGLRTSPESVVREGVP